MKRKILVLIISVILIFVFAFNALGVTHTVQKGETLWKIGQKYKVDVNAIKKANPQIKNFALIYPGQKIEVPLNDEDLQAFEKEVIRLTNLKRTANGLKPLTANTLLSKTARYKSWDMHDKKYFSHQSPTYGSPFEMMKKFGISYRTAGENIAMGQSTPAKVVEAWWNSPGHKANMMNSAFTEIGVGYVKDGHYWTQMFKG